MSERELQRVEVLSGVVAGRMTVVGAATALSMSRRQVHRLLTLYRVRGGHGLAPQSTRAAVQPGSK